MATEHEELERGQLAADVLGNRVYQESMAQLRDEILKRWPVEASEEHREHLHRMIVTANKFESIIKEIMETGKLRQGQIARDRSKLERLGDKFRRD